VFYICSVWGMGAGDLSDCITVIATAVSRNASPQLEEPIVGLLNCGVSVAGIGARQDLRVKWACPQKALQALEKIDSAPGKGTAGAAVDIAGSAGRDGDPLLARREPALPPKGARFGAQDVDIARAPVDIARLVGCDGRPGAPTSLRAAKQRAGLGVASARKWRRNGLKTLNPRLEMVWPRTPRIPNIWRQGATRKASDRETSGDERVFVGGPTRLLAQGGRDPRKRRFLAPKRLKTKARGQT